MHVGDQPGVVARRPLVGNVPNQGQTQKLKTPLLSPKFEIIEYFQYGDEAALNESVYYLKNVVYRRNFN